MERTHIVVPPDEILKNYQNINVAGNSGLIIVCRLSV